MSDIRQDPEVVKTYKEMGGTTDVLWGVETKPLLLSVGDLAFFMRDKARGLGLHEKERMRIYKSITGVNADSPDELDCYREWWMYMATKEQWIKAAVAAWEAKE